MPLDEKTLDYVCKKSNEMIEKQLASYREKKSITATIIGINTLFVPFFFSGLQDAYWWVKALSFLPLTAICVALYKFISMYHLKSLAHGVNVNLYNDLAQMDFETVSLKEISVNQYSFKQNEVILEKVNKSYQIGVYYTVSALVLSIFVLSLNFFCSPEKAATKIEIVNRKIMENNNNNSGSGNPVQTNPNVLTTVSPADVQIIKEDKTNK